MSSVASGHTPDAVLAWLESEASDEHREGLLRYGIPNERALGVPMGVMKKKAKAVGRSHDLALGLWDLEIYEARTMAAFVDEPATVEVAQMERWAGDFDNWAICDTVCFHLFDRTAHAWTMSEEWVTRSEEFVRRAGFAVIWGLSVHDKKADDALFESALTWIAETESDDRPLVKKAVNMALRAIGKRNGALHRSACRVAESLDASPDRHRSWIGSHALRELTSDKVQEKVASR